jgi:hypothetical protein
MKTRSDSSQNDLLAPQAFVFDLNKLPLRGNVTDNVYQP